MKSKISVLILTAAALFGGTAFLLRTMVTSEFLLFCSAAIFGFLVQTALHCFPGMRLLPPVLAFAAQAVCLAVMIADGFFSPVPASGGSAGVTAAAFCLLLAVELGGFALSWASLAVMKLSQSQRA